MGGRRKRQHRKPDLSGVKTVFAKKRGKLVMTQETEVIRTTKELEAELKALTQAKKAATKEKDRKRRQPAPIQERKALDYLPTTAGLRMDRKTRLERWRAKKEERAAKKERRRLAKLKRDQVRSRELDIKGFLGDDFFAPADDQAVGAEDGAELPPKKSPKIAAASPKVAAASEEPLAKSPKVAPVSDGGAGKSPKVAAASAEVAASKSPKIAGAKSPKLSAASAKSPKLGAKSPKLGAKSPKVAAASEPPPKSPRKSPLAAAAAS